MSTEQPNLNETGSKDESRQMTPEEIVGSMRAFNDYDKSQIAKAEIYLAEAKARAERLADSKGFEDWKRDAQNNIEVFSKFIEEFDERIETREKVIEEYFGKTKIAKEWEENAPSR